MPHLIRPATAADLDAVLALVAALAEFEQLPGPDAGARARFAADFARQPRPFELLVACDPAGRVDAYAIYFFTYSTFLARASLYLEDLFVHPRVRSQGLGARLMRSLAGVAVARDCGRFEWTVLGWNTRAQAFYRRLGAELLDQWLGCRVDGERLSALAAADLSPPAANG